MTLSLSGWTFVIDLPSNQAYYLDELQANCGCDFCQNFYQNADAHYPHLRPLLERFGVELFAPDSMTPYISNGFVEYEISFKVLGKITQYGEDPITVDDLQIMFGPGESECFYIDFSLNLPWTLEVPIEQAAYSQPNELYDNWIETPIS